MISLSLSFKFYEPNFLHLQIENLQKKRKLLSLSSFLSHPFLFLPSVHVCMHAHVCLLCVGSEYIYVCAYRMPEENFS